MAQSGFTPIQLYRSTTAAAVPTAGNLVAGELAINLADEKLYFENASGVVKVLADAAALGTVTSVAASGGTTGLSFTGSPITTTGTLTLSGTLGVANGGTGQTTYTNGQLLIGNSTGNTLTKATLTAGTNISITNGAGAITINATDQFVGTVTSVNASGGTTGLTFSGGPITTSGTLTLAGTLGVANGGTGTATAFTAGSVVFAGASGVYSQDNANLFWDNTNDRLGIGTASPTGRLEVSQVTTATAAIQITATSGTNPYQAFTDPFGTAAIAGGGGTLLLRAGGAGAGDNKVYVLSSGNVGIGAASPTERLSVSGNIRLPDNNNIYWGGTANYITGSNASNFLALGTNNLERMRITSAGDVGVGNTPSGTYKLEVTGALFASSAVLGAALPVASGGTGQTTYTNGQLLIGNTTGNTLTKATLTAGSGVSITNGTGTITIAATGSGGTVTSVSGAGTVNGITLTGTVTSSGSLTLGGTLSNVSLATQVTGTLPVANGGTGATTAGAALSALGGAAAGAVGSSGLTMNTARMLGRTTASAGTIEEISIGTGLSLSGGTLSSTASGGTVTSVAASGGTTGLSFTGSPITSSGTLTLTGTLAIANGGTGATTASAARTALGSTTVGDNLFTLTNPSAVRFLRVNADNTVSALDATNFRTAIGAGTGSGTVTSVDAAGGTTGLSFSGGPVTGSGTLTLAGTLAVTNGGTGGTTQSAARSGLGATVVGANFFTLTNPSSVTFVRVNADNTISTLDAATFRSAIGAGAVTSVSGAGTVNGLTLSGTVTGSGNITLGGTLSGIANSALSNSAITINGSSIALGGSVSVGTVTSVSGTGSTNGLSLSGTVTGSGNITLSGSVTSVATSATIDGVTIGYRSIPRSTTSGTAVVADVGKCIAVSAGITIPNSTFAAGDAVSIYNDSGSAITITAGVTTLRQAGTGNTGNRTLAARGMATVWFNSATEAVISGAGVS